eukprot:1371482-Rhodomonas_salina.1
MSHRTTNAGLPDSVPQPVPHHRPPYTYASTTPPIGLRACLLAAYARHSTSLPARGLRRRREKPEPKTQRSATATGLEHTAGSTTHSLSTGDTQGRATATIMVLRIS